MNAFAIGHIFVGRFGRRVSVGESWGTLRMADVFDDMETNGHYGGLQL